MASKSTTPKNQEDLQLTFRVEQPPSAAPTWIPRSWALWCLVGIVLGASAWWFSKSLLVQGLSKKFEAAETRGEALVALQQLAIVGDDATGELGRALMHSDEEVARAAYLMLDDRLSGWLAAVEKHQKPISELAAALNSLPDDALPTRLELAELLASRVLVRLRDLPDNSMASVVTACEGAVAKSRQSVGRATIQVPLVDEVSGEASSEVVLNAQDAAQNTATEGSGLSSVPPPLDRVSALPADGSVPPAKGVTLRLSDSGEAPTGLDRGVATIEVTPRQTGAGARLVAETSASYAGPMVPRGGMQADRLPGAISTPAVAAINPPIAQVYQPPSFDAETIKAMPIEQLVRLLGVDDGQVVRTASLALRTRGMSDSLIQFASQVAVVLATGAREEKIAVAQTVATRPDLGEPWLLWIAEDRDPEVRRAAVGLLSGRVDEEIGKKLRTMLSYEAHPEVAQTLRQVLSPQTPKLR
ncbi:MAG TPA: hypothetical protein DDW52_06040 [Planctomycetaceae bacterium]|nr:hypothetical protein [Planctomycetaceae bacterium]